MAGSEGSLVTTLLSRAESRSERSMFRAALVLLLSFLPLACASVGSDGLVIRAEPAAEYAADQLIQAYVAAHPELAVQKAVRDGRADVDIALARPAEAVSASSVVREDALVLWGIRNRQLRLRKAGVAALSSERVTRVVVLEPHRQLAVAALEASSADQRVLAKLATLATARAAVDEVTSGTAQFAILPESVASELGGPEGRFWRFPPEAMPPLRIVIVGRRDTEAVRRFISVSRSVGEPPPTD